MVKNALPQQKRLLLRSVDTTRRACTYTCEGLLEHAGQNLFCPSSHPCITTHFMWSHRDNATALQHGPTVDRSWDEGFRRSSKPTILAFVTRLRLRSVSVAATLGRCIFNSHLTLPPPSAKKFEFPRNCPSPAQRVLARPSLEEQVPTQTDKNTYAQARHREEKETHLMGPRNELN